jgi:hypothetical protein
MADYGHDLIFGTFLSPQNAEPQAPVALARLSERAGLDLVTFQDHPYQPAFLDTWTLLSYVAASTERIKISGNVINLPLRPPVLLARQAASLDLLSGGRFELGLGAGAFWDAIEAMGGPRRSPAEAVASLSEAIDLIRATWDAGRRGGIFADGEQYRIRGAKRGPEPAHDVSVWLGVLGPRMLRLAGRRPTAGCPAWPTSSPATWNAATPSSTRPPPRPAGIRARSAACSTSRRRRQESITSCRSSCATASPRSSWPATIRGPSRPGARRSRPRCREAVAREREAAGTESGDVVRGPKALALRRDGIAYHALPAALRATAVEPGDKAYPKVRSTYLRSGAPGLVLRPGTARRSPRRWCSPGSSRSRSPCVPAATASAAGPPTTAASSSTWPGSTAWS